MQSHYLSNILFSFSGAGKFYLKTYSRGKMSRAQSSRIYSSTYGSFSALRSPSEVVLRKRHQCNTFIPHPPYCVLCFFFFKHNRTICHPCHQRRFNSSQQNTHAKQILRSTTVALPSRHAFIQIQYPQLLISHSRVVILPSPSSSRTPITTTDQYTFGFIHTVPFHLPALTTKHR